MKQLLLSLSFSLTLVGLAPPSPSPPANAASQGFLVAAGDVACAAGKNFTDTQCHERPTAELFGPAGVLSGSKAVLVTGDNQYNLGYYSSFIYTRAGCTSNPETQPCSFDQSWGFNGGNLGTTPIYATPGSHDYNDNVDRSSDPGCTSDMSPAFHLNMPSDSACGYERYYGRSRVDPDLNGGNYYETINGGTAHPLLIISVNNGQCINLSMFDPCQVGGSTYTWLRNTLASTSVNPANDCVIVLSYAPRWDQWDHGNLGWDDDMWRAMFKSRFGGTSNQEPDLWIGGHDHVYERYAAIDINGNLASGTTPGIPEIVIGTGGHDKRVNPQVTNPPTPAYHQFVFGTLKIAYETNAGTLSTTFYKESGQPNADGTTTYTCNA